MLNFLKNKTLILLITILILISRGCKIREKEVFIDENNFINIKSTPFFPIGIFSANPPSALKELKNVGFNTVQTYRITSFEKLNGYLSEAEKVGMKCLVYPGYRIDDNPPDYSNLIKIEKEWGKLEENLSILCWYLADEPSLKGISPERLNNFYNLMQRLDPRHPKAVVSLRPRNYRDCCDIMIVDPYPVPFYPLAKVAEVIEHAKRVVKNKKPIWIVLQAFDWNEFDKRLKEKSLGRNPTYEELRCMSYLSVIKGVRGIFYYTFHELGYKIKEHPQLWADLKKVISELNNIYYLLVLPEEKDKIKLVKGNPAIHYTVKKSRKNKYLLAVNVTGKKVEAVFKRLKFFDRSLPILFENREVKITKGVFSDTFYPYDVHIYRKEILWYEKYGILILSCLLIVVLFVFIIYRKIRV